MSSRPVYIPSRKRSRAAGAAQPHKQQQQPQRFHGAFEGGFSAGYYNTVGSQEGWEPNSNNHNTDQSSTTRHQQKPEDFMDDQDFDEWGGPKAVRSEYQQQETADATTMVPTTSQKSLLDAMVMIKPPMNIGRQLLRVLGWRDGSNTAYVPSHSDTKLTTITPTTTTNDSENVHQHQSQLVLSQRKLRKIQLQQQRVRIPTAKNDTCGLGFVPYEDAPEFRAARERRQQLARERALAAVQGSGRNVYRVSNLLTVAGDNHQQQLTQTPKDTAHDDPYNSYETTEDFVGSKSVGGFALREDDDDVYDDDNMLVERDAAPMLDREQYDTVVYEHESDPEDNDLSRPAKPTTKSSAGLDLSGLLSTWATGKGDHVKPNESEKKLASTASSVAMGLTADGRPQLSGFVLGTSSLPGASVQRYPGPTIPVDYNVYRHVFTLEHMPSTLQVLSRAVQLEMVDERKRTALQDALEVNAAANAPARQRDTEKPMAGPTFSALAEAMKNRFRSSETQVASDAAAPDITASDKRKNEECTGAGKREVNITRTVMSFIPSSLLCKRFHVPMPKGAAAGMEASGKVSEATYFQNEILNTAQSAHASKPNEGQPTGDDPKKLMEKEPVQFEMDTSSFEAEVKDRPSMEVYKSIYEPDVKSPSQSDDDDDDCLFEEKSGEKMTTDKRGQPNAKLDENKQDTLEISDNTKNNVNDNAGLLPFFDPKVAEETSLIPYQSAQENRDGKKSRLENGSSDDLSTEEEERRHKRKRKDRKKTKLEWRDERRKKRRKKESKSERKRERKHS